MSAQYALLGMLRESPNYGYELKKTYDKLFGAEKPILAGQVYSVLSRLKRDHRIEVVEDFESSAGPDRIKYGITRLGKSDLETWLETPEEPSPQFQATLFMKVVIALMEGGDAAPFLDRQRHAHIECMRKFTARRREAPLAAKLVLDHAIFHVEADLRWIDLASSRLTKLKEELCK